MSLATLFWFLAYLHDTLPSFFFVRVTCQLHHDLEALHLRHGRVIDTAFVFPAKTKYYRSDSGTGNSSNASKDKRKEVPQSTKLEESNTASSKNENGEEGIGKGVEKCVLVSPKASTTKAAETTPTTPTKEKAGEVEQRKRLPPSLPLRFLVHVLLECKPVNTYDPDEGYAPGTVAAVTAVSDAQASKSPDALPPSNLTTTTAASSEKKNASKAAAPAGDLDEDGWEIVTRTPRSRSRGLPTPPPSTPSLAPVPAPVPIASLPLPHDSLEDARWSLEVAQVAAAAWNSGSLADAAAHMQAPQWQLPSRPRGVGLRNIPLGAASALAQWAATCAHGANYPCKEHSQKSGAKKGGKQADSKQADAVSDVGNVHPIGLTPPCYGFMRTPFKSSAAPEKAPLTAAPTVEEGSSPVSKPTESDGGDRRAADNVASTPAVVGKAALVFASTPARDRWFEYALLSLGAAHQVRLWPLPIGTNWKTLAAALDAIGLGPAKYIKVDASRANKSTMTSAVPSLSDAPVAYVTFQHKRHAYRALGLTFPSEQDPNEPSEQPVVPYSAESPKDHKIHVILNGKQAALLATLPRVDDFKATVPGVPGEIFFARR